MILVKRFTRAAVLLAIVALGCDPKEGETPIGSLPVPPTGRWEDFPPLPNSRSEHGASQLDRFVYVMGGIGSETDAILAVDRFNLDSRSWTENITELRVGVNNAGMATVGSRLYLIGGFERTTLNARELVQIFDPTSGWEFGAPMPTPRGAHSVVVLDGKIHAIGGFTEGLGREAVSAVHEVYDPVEDSWETLASLPDPRESAAAGVVNGKIYVATGRNNAGQDLRSMVIYDPQEDTWSSGPPAPTPRASAIGAVLDDRFHVLGGESIIQGQTFAVNERFDPALERWETDTPMLTSRHGLSSTVTSEGQGRIYLMGGSTGTGRGSSSVNERYVPGDDRLNP